jgi:hypothetical protein
MAVKSYPLHDKQDSVAFNPGKIGAVLTAIVSWVTTYWCVVWIMQPTAGEYAAPIGVAVVAELVLTLMKRCLFNDDRSDDGIGWAGIIVDTIINAGGILPRAGRLLTFPPIAAILALIGVNTASPTVQSVGGFIISVIAGALLSVLPHRLWHSGD